MEDAHLVYLFDAASLQGTTIQRSSRPIALFGVYDGHGGPQVSQFVARHLIDELIKTPDFRKGKQPNCLQHDDNCDGDAS